MTCPIPCDDDCYVWCHETHQVYWKRHHDPDKCPGSRCTGAVRRSQEYVEPERCGLFDGHEGECA